MPSSRSPGPCSFSSSSSGRRWPRGLSRARTGAPKKILFLTYPGVGAPGSHGHASLPAAEEQAVVYGKVRRVRCHDAQGLRAGRRQAGPDVLHASVSGPVRRADDDGQRRHRHDGGAEKGDRRFRERREGVHRRPLCDGDDVRLPGVRRDAGRLLLQFDGDAAARQRRAGEPAARWRPQSRRYEASGDADAGIELAGCRGVLHVRDGAVEREKSRGESLIARELQGADGLLARPRARPAQPRHRSHEPRRVRTARERQERRRLPAVVVAQLGQGPRVLHVARTPAGNVDERLRVPGAPDRRDPLGARPRELGHARTRR